MISNPHIAAAAADGRPHIHFLPGYCRTMEAERPRRGEILANLAARSTVLAGTYFSLFHGFHGYVETSNDQLHY